ncbi:MAG: helix-hairpin-helix domain-containing protein [Candidatus Woesebacteria bacterium]|nr:MAG: helix-hairpin-helix domain-containing protein [Candidatus Woesebacteria bacterium]
MLSKYKVSLILVFVGIIFAIGGVVLSRSGIFDESKVEIIENGSKMEATPNLTEKIVVEIAGSVEKPGVYKIDKGNSRIDDLLVMSGGLSKDANREYVSKNINKAIKLSDGQKIYIPSIYEQKDVLSAKAEVSQDFISDNKININEASLEVLDTLPGIGQVYAKSIIEQRPYSEISELVSRGVIKQSLFEKIKDRIVVF